MNAWDWMLLAAVLVGAGFALAHLLKHKKSGPSQRLMTSLRRSCVNRFSIASTPLGILCLPGQNCASPHEKRADAKASTRSVIFFRSSRRTSDSFRSSRSFLLQV